ncbi:MAG: hypothetical protein E6J00_14105 [Chloroflexi bacterium]|nr:MAG: hypothetical protein E6J00_14105 [Chloroflexota bacterium]
MCEATRPDPTGLLAAAVDAFVAFFAEAPPAALGEAMIDCRRQMDRLEAGFTQAAGRFATNREYAVEGAPSAVSWLKANCRMSAGAAAERLNIARQMDQLPPARGSDRQGRQPGRYGHRARGGGRPLEDGG